MDQTLPLHSFTGAKPCRTPSPADGRVGDDVRLLRLAALARATGIALVDAVDVWWWLSGIGPGYTPGSPTPAVPEVIVSRLAALGLDRADLERELGATVAQLVGSAART